MWRALPAICAAIAAREEALVVLVEGQGGHFSAGADISEFGEVYRDAAAARDYGDAVQDGLRALIELDRPSIAVLQGNAVGGGLGLALACDLRFCAADAYLAITPAKLGLVYGHAETRRLVELVGPSRAKDLLFTGRRIETDEALAIGLIDRRIETGLHDTALGYARGLADLSQASIRGAKRTVDAVVGRHDRRNAGVPRASSSPPRSASTLPRDALRSPRSGRRSSPIAARRSGSGKADDDPSAEGRSVAVCSCSSRAGRLRIGLRRRDRRRRRIADPAVARAGGP